MKGRRSRSSSANSSHCREIETLKSKKTGAPTDELREVIDDNVPIVMTLPIVFLLAVMVWLPVFEPF